MTAAEVLEAMARGMWEASVSTATPWEKVSQSTRERMKSHIRAAVRAAQEVGAILVAEMPEEQTHPMNKNTVSNALGIERCLGHNAALAAVRAAAVVVEDAP